METSEVQSQNLARIARSFALPNLRSCFNSNKSDRRQDSANVDDSDEVCRLGKRELGKYANEKRMPARLHKLLEENDRKNAENAPALVPVLARMIEKDDAIRTAYLCHESIRYISKIKGEGNTFCGYRNIQMLFSYFQGAPPGGCEQFEGPIPSVLDLQNMIEQAWDKGINDYGRIQTDGVRDTRKFVGTPEAQAILQDRSIECKGTAFQNVEGGLKAYEELLDSVEQYFVPISDPPYDNGPYKVRVTALPPMFLQRPGHSMTIIGLLIRRDGSRELLVFDPAYAPRKQMIAFASALDTVEHTPRVLKAFRRGQAYLRKFNAFETLRLSEEGLMTPNDDKIELRRNHV